MDKMIHTALNTLNNIHINRSVKSQNLSNINVPGFRRDLGTSFSAGFLEQMDQFPSRVFALHEGANIFSAKPGNIKSTGQETDLAIKGSGFFITKPASGEPSLSRRGDLGVSGDGFLINGAGAQMLDLNQAPIAVPPFRKLVVSETGEMFIEPLGSEEGTRVALGTLATTSGSETPMKKDTDGEIRLVGGGVPAPDQNSVIAQSFLEESNVNAVEELVDTLSQQRQFEINVKFITLSKEMDEGSAGIMRMPN